MRRIYPRIALLFFVLLTFASVASATTDAMETQNAIDFELVLVAEPLMTSAEQAGDLDQAGWLLPEFAPAATHFICSGPPPSCVCGRCCECFVCWKDGVFPVFGCDR